MLSVDELRELYERTDGPRVSLYFPVNRGDSAYSHNSIRLKNLVKEAENRLVESGVRTSVARDMLQPAEKLILDEPSWRQADGLAVFADSGQFRFYRLPFSPEEIAFVSDRFYVKPLLYSLNDNWRFYVLALSQKRVRLFTCTSREIEEVKLEQVDIPLSLEEALKYDDPEKQVQYHTPSPGRAQIFHGHSVNDDSKQNILRFFYLLDKGLKPLLSSQGIPLILAGVSYLIPLYREANSYQPLLPEYVEGNPDRISSEELHSRALEVAKPYLTRGKEEAAQKIKSLLGTGLASSDIRDIVPAACHGRISALFAVRGVQQWGVFDRTSGQLQIMETSQNGCEDLLELAAVHTLANKGTLYFVEKSEMPANGPVAALFRY